MCACGADRRVGWRECCESLRIMKLYEVYVNNGLDYDDESAFTVVVVARNEDEAEEKAKQNPTYKYHVTHNTYMEVTELDIVDGYRIILEKVR